MATDLHFRPGENCWRVERAGRVAFLRNADAYYHEVAKAILAAQRTVFILAWDFDRRILLTRGRPDDQIPSYTLGDLLLERVEATPGLEVRILVWRNAPLFTKAHEGFDFLEPVKLDHPRIWIELDGDHPPFSTHHQKVAVIDDAVAFCGGMDLTQSRWDTAEHAPNDPRRRELDEELYRPYHDVQIVVDGDAAAALGELARIRWRRAVGEDDEDDEDAEVDGDGADGAEAADGADAAIRAVGADDAIGTVDADDAGDTHAHDPATLGDPWPDGLEPDVQDVDVAISRTEPEWDGRDGVYEIERLYLDQIGGAEELIFIEQQYLSDGGVCDAMCDRLREDDGPEIVLILPRDTTGIIARLTMETMLIERLKRLRDADRRGRLRVFFPDAPGIPREPGTSINVHAKLLIADDRLVRIGSSNLNKKSMRSDTECDLSIHAGDDPLVSEAIRAFRHKLIAEHFNLPPERIAEAEADAPSVGEAIASLAVEDGPTLRPYQSGMPGWLVDVLARVPWLDPERGDRRPFQPPRSLNGHAGHAASSGEAGSKAQGMIWPIVAGTALLLALAAAWRWGPLADAAEPAALVELLQSAPWTGPALVVLYVVGTIIMVPVHLLHIVAALALGFRVGMTWAVAGTMLSSIAAYGIGALVGTERLRRVFGHRVSDLSRRAGAAGLRGAVLLRLMPGLPFGMVNMIFGASHVRFGPFVGATALVMLPSLIAMAIAGERMRTVWTDPTPENIGIFVAVVAMLGLGLWLAKKVVDRLGRGMGIGSSE